MVFQAVEADLAEAAPVGVGKKMRKENPKKFFTKEEKEKIVHAIQEAEQKTSGEIRVHLASSCKKSVLEEATETFEKLGMTQTKVRNGILFFLSLSDHQFAILGDIGIHEKVHKEFWDHIRDTVIESFKKEEFSEGLIAGIHECGEKLKLYFPRDHTDQNELSNDVSSF